MTLRHESGSAGHGPPYVNELALTSSSALLTREDAAGDSTLGPSSTSLPVPLPLPSQLLRPLGVELPSLLLPPPLLWRSAVHGSSSSEAVKLDEACGGEGQGRRGRVGQRFASLVR